MQQPEQTKAAKTKTGKRLSTQFIWPIWLSAGAALLLGFGAGAWVVTTEQSPQLEQQRKSISSLNGRVALLASALNSQSDLFAKLDAPPAPTPVELPDLPQVTTTITPPHVDTELQKKLAETESVDSSAKVNESSKTKKQLRKEKRERERAEAEALAAASATTQALAVAEPQKTTPAVQAAPIAATPPPVATANAFAPSESVPPKTNRIEGVSMDKAGIVKLWADAVDFKSGIRVRKGEKFPSGERLLSVDSVNGRIVTDQRQILILD